MVEFTDWSQALVFFLIFSVIVLLPCFVVTKLGTKVIDELGYFPSKAAIIHMKAFWWLVCTEILTFVVLMGFFNFFQAK
ncbi:MAG: hypothetical protein HQL27_07135 [Candidatus Omnitrophica bacterium]|nr:hypothetical protein [Candidatus Omnitrophota bacterium]